MDRSVFFKLSATLLSVSILAACGGGGSSSEPSTPTQSTPPPQPLPPPAFTVNVDHPLSGKLNESTSNNIDLSYSGAQRNVTTSVVVNGATDLVTVTTSEIDGGVRLTIDVDEMFFANDSVEIDIAFKDGDGRTQDVRFQYALNNVSGNAVRDSFEALVSATQAWLPMNSSATLLERLVRIAQMSNADNASSLESDIQFIIDGNQVNALSVEIDNALSEIERYNDGDLSEETFGSLTDELIQMANEVYAPVANAITSISVVNQSLMPRIDMEAGPNYSIQYDKISPFIGNPALGAYSDDHWIFNDNVAFLNDIVFSESLSCEAE